MSRYLLIRHLLVSNFTDENGITAESELQKPFCFLHGYLDLNLDFNHFGY